MKQYSDSQYQAMVDDAITVAAYFNSLPHGRAIYAQVDGKRITPTMDEVTQASQRLMRVIMFPVDS